MSLAKAVISGTVLREPKITSPQNNMDLKIVSFAVTIDDNNDDLLRVVAFGNLAETVEKSVKAGSKVVVEGQLRTYVGKDIHGQDQKTLELRLGSIEVMGSSSSSSNNTGSSTQNSSEVVKFSETEEFAEDLIGDEEIPF